MQQPASRETVADRSSERAQERPANPRSRTRGASSPRPADSPDPSAPSSNSPADAIDAARPDREQLIATRAYGLFLDRGMSHGGDVDDWLEAERQVDSELGPIPQ